MPTPTSALTLRRPDRTSEHRAVLSDAARFQGAGRCVACEVNTDSVGVLSVFPGRTATPRIEALHDKEGRRYPPGLLLQPEDVASVVTNALALPWTAEVTNISIRPM